MAVRPNLLYVQKQGGWNNASMLLQAYAHYVEQGEETPRRLPTLPRRNRDRARALANAG